MFIAVDDRVAAVAHSTVCLSTVGGAHHALLEAIVAVFGLPVTVITRLGRIDNMIATDMNRAHGELALGRTHHTRLPTIFTRLCQLVSIVAALSGEHIPNAVSTD